MKRIEKVQLACGLALSLAGAALAQRSEPPVARPVPLPTEQLGMAPVPNAGGVPEEKDDHSNLLGLAEHGMVFDGVLVRATAYTPPGMRVIVTRYEFVVHEWLRGDRRDRVITLDELGGVNPDGSGMTTEHSHKLTVGGRYLILAKHDAENILAPFERVLQILDAGSLIADEQGRLVTSIRNGYLATKRTPEVASARYLGASVPPPQPTDMGPPEWSSEPLPAQPPRPSDPDAAAPISAREVLSALRLAGVQPPADLGPRGLPGPGAQNAVDWSNCGWSGGRRAYAYWIGATQLPWFDDSMVWWNELVAPGGAAGGAMYTRFVNGSGQPITNTFPGANNGTNNAGTPSSADLTAGGYPTWAAQSNPNGVCFQWFSGSCGRLVECDTFVNPVNNGSEIQFRKSCVHELGHAYGANHEDRFVAIMVAGTWRVTPNYASNRYTRVDDILGARQVMDFTNQQLGNVFNFNNSWRDIATHGQAHPNWGTSGDIGPWVTTTNTTFYNTGDTVTLSRLYTENRGATAFGGPVTLKVYLSSNNIISSGDFEVWSGGWASYGGFGVSNNWSLNFTVPSSVPSGTYYVGWILTSGEAELETGNNIGIMTTDSGGSFAQRTIQINNITPANDACGNALPITAGNTYFGNTNGATTDGAAACQSNSGKDVWYRWTAPCNGTFTASTCGTSWDTVLSAYLGSCSGISLACSDDNGCGSFTLQSAISLPVTGGTTYIIRLGGYNNGSGSFTMSTGFTPSIPGNNLCSNATALFGSSASATGSTSCAAPGLFAPSCSNSLTSPEVWYTWTPQCSGIATVDTCGSGYDTVISAWDGCPSGGGLELGCDDDGCGYPYSRMSFPVVAGTPYWIRVAGYNGASGTFALNTSVSTDAPANDDCSAASPIADGSYSYETCGATNDATPAFSCNGLIRSLGRNIWYIYTPAAAGTVSINTCDANYDSLIAVYAGGCPSSASLVACSDDACGTSGLGSSLSFAGDPGTTYYISVGGYSTATGAGTLVVQGPAACYANCDQSTTPPILNPLDFTCFLDRYRAGDAYANCDGSTTPPELNALDFVCFLSQYRAGCK